MKKKRIFLLLCVLLLLLCLFIFFRTKAPEEIKDLLPIDNVAEEWDGNQKLPSQNKTKEIAIPGVTDLVFYAGEKNQKVNFYNPPENTCLFLMTLFVDGVEMWKSGYVRPNSGYYDIALSDTLEVGEYIGMLQMQCFREDGTALNGATVKFDILVEER